MPRHAVARTKAKANRANEASAKTTSGAAPVGTGMRFFMLSFSLLDSSAREELAGRPK